MPEKAEFEIRHAREEDLPRIFEIYAGARVFMREHGNPKQWNTKWPPEELVREDIRVQRNYVCLHEGKIVAVFVYIQGVDVDPTYLKIEEGDWAWAGEYGAVHRIASSREIPGTASFCLDWACHQCGHVRIDTHGDNYVMQNLLKKNGFEIRGVIHVVEDNDPRIAFEKSLSGLKERKN